jgi:hypothetical protein
MMFIKYAAVQLQQLGLKKKMDLFAGTQQQRDQKDESSKAEGDTDEEKVGN